MQDACDCSIVHCTNSSPPAVFAGAGCSMCGRYFPRARMTIAPQHGGRAHALRWQSSQALDLPCGVSRVAGAVSAIWLGLWSGCVEVGAARSRAQEGDYLPLSSGSYCYFIFAFMYSTYSSSKKSSPYDRDTIRFSVAPRACDASHAPQLGWWISDTVDGAVEPTRRA